MGIRLKKGDQVIVLSGADKGKVGPITQILPSQSRVVVDGVNLRTKHIKKTSTRRTGGLERAPRPIHASNVGLLRPGSKNRATRVGFSTKSGGKKIRIATQAGGKAIKS